MRSGPELSPPPNFEYQVREVASGRALAVAVAADMFTTTEKDKAKGCDNKCEGLGEPHKEGFGLKKRYGCTDLLFLAMFIELAPKSAALL